MTTPPPQVVDVFLDEAAAAHLERCLCCWELWPDEVIADDQCPECAGECPRVAEDHEPSRDCRR